jgi:hypothetical protein
MQPIDHVIVMSQSVLALVIALHVATCSAQAQMHKLFPWFHRSDPAIESQIFVIRPCIRLDAGRIGILDFQTAQDGEPLPPPFSPFILQALSRQGIQASRVALPSPSALASKQAEARFSESQRITLALDHSNAAGTGLLVSGQLDALYRTASGGLVIKITAQLWDVEARSQVWSGRLSLNWNKRYPLED